MTARVSRINLVCWNTPEQSEEQAHREYVLPWDEDVPVQVGETFSVYTDHTPPERHSEATRPWDSRISGARVLGGRPHQGRGRGRSVHNHHPPSCSGRQWTPALTRRTGSRAAGHPSRRPQYNAPVAQRTERLASTQYVPGSNPGRCSIPNEQPPAEQQQRGETNGTRT